MPVIWIHEEEYQILNSQRHIIPGTKKFESFADVVEKILKEVKKT
jgi:hypothetical protein